MLTLRCSIRHSARESKPQLLESWAEFCGSFLPAAAPPTTGGAGQTVSGGTVQPSLASGRANAADLEKSLEGGPPSPRTAVDNTDRNKSGKFGAMNWCSPPPLQFPSLN